jgi:hypothetical protein
MPKVYISSVIPAPAPDVWRIIRNFNALPDWTPFVADSRIEGGQRPDEVGCIRNFRLRDGGTIRERLLALSDYDLSCTYEIIESPMEVTDYTATLSLIPITETNATLAQWQADFDCPPHRASELIRHIGDTVFQSAFTALKKQLGGR